MDGIWEKNINLRKLVLQCLSKASQLSDIKDNFTMHLFPKPWLFWLLHTRKSNTAIQKNCEFKVLYQWNPSKKTIYNIVIIDTVKNIEP